MAFLNIAPTGTVLPFVGINAPEGWLLCDGTPKLRTTYADLFSRISIPITVSSTNGSTTLNTGAVNPATLGIAAGMPISGTGIQAGTTVSSTTATTIVLSLAATATNASVVVVVCPYGVGDGSTTFNLPDMRGVFPRGSGTNGTVNYGGVTGHTPAGGALAVKGGQKTAKNGLSASAGSSSASVTGAKNQLNNSTGSASNTSWLIGVLGSTSNGFSWGGHSLARGGTLSGNNGDGSFPGQDHSHSFSYGGDFSASGTAAAQTITVAAGDTETTPAFLALNYIIKL